MNDIASLAWKISAVRGVLGIILGLILLIRPTTALVFVLLWGIFVLVDALGWFASAFSKGLSPLGRAGAVVLGILAVAAALLAILRPSLTVAVLMVLLGIWLVVRGVAGGLLAAIVARGQARWWLLLGAVLDIAVGVLFFLNPTGSASVIVRLIGIGVILWGLVLLLLALRLRKQPEDITPDGMVIIKGEVV